MGIVWSKLGNHDVWNGETLYWKTDIIKECGQFQWYIRRKGEVTGITKLYGVEDTEERAKTEAELWIGRLSKLNG